MLRNLTIIALLGVLTACSAQGENDTTTAPADANASGAAGSAAAEASDGSTDGTSGTASAACTEAFGALAADEITSLSDLAELEGVEATIEQCESIDDWTAGAQEVIGEEVNPATARLLLEIRCELPALSDTAVCEEISAS